MHTPFPSSEIFRTISLRESLLRGMLAADHIGFHLFEYARHFLTCCRRILGVTYEPSPDGAGMLVNYNGRRLLVSRVPAGVHPLVLRNQVRLPEVAGTVATLADRYAGYTVLGGIDRIERLKALPLKLLACVARSRGACDASATHSLSPPPPPLGTNASSSGASPERSETAW